MDDITHILETTRTVAIVGMSDNPERASHEVAHYLQAGGYRIIPVNPGLAQKGEKVLGETPYADLEAAAKGLKDAGEAPIDMVDVFRKVEEIPAIAKSAVAIGAKTLWQQLGLMSEEADRTATEAGLDSVWDRCVKIEHARLFGGLNWAGVNTKVISAHRPRQG